MNESFRAVIGTHFLSNPEPMQASDNSQTKVFASSRQLVDVKIFTMNRQQIRGQLSISGSYRSRLSDLLNGERIFISVTKARIYDAKGELVTQSPFLCLNKESIDFVIEENPLEHHYLN